MSTSDSQGREPLTRKQMREIRLTGSTPVISEEEAAAAPPTPPAPPLPPVVEPAPVAPTAASESGSAPLTRRQARERERARTASVPVVAPEDEQTDASVETGSDQEAGQLSEAASEPAQPEEIVSAVPAFAPTSVQQAEPAEVVDEAPESEGEEPAADLPAVIGEADADIDLTDLGVDADAIEEIDEDDQDTGERPTVSPSFGSGVLAQETPTQAFTPSFDDLITVGDTTGSQSIAPSALIFTPPPGEGSLSGPVASTGELLITGTYTLPEGIGSQGHAKGVADGKDVDAVLIDGELPPASSPTPIAASSAISTNKPAGEIIRPPAPEKGNRLMLTLAITAGGLALVLAAALVFAFTSNVFG